MIRAGRNVNLTNENRTNVLGNRVDRKTENPTEASPEDVPITDKDTINSKLKENNIGRVNTPEQRVGNNNKSDNRDIYKNNVLAGSKPFKPEVKPFEREAPRKTLIDTRVGFTFNRGNFFVNEVDPMPDTEKFKLSKKKDVREEDRAKNFNDFFN